MGLGTQQGCCRRALLVGCVTWTMVFAVRGLLACLNRGIDDGLRAEPCRSVGRPSCGLGMPKVCCARCKEYRRWGLESKKLQSKMLLASERKSATVPCRAIFSRHLLTQSGPFVGHDYAAEVVLAAMF